MHSNTTIVNVKFTYIRIIKFNYIIQIQQLLMLNARKINLYDFHYTIKSIDIQGF